MTNTQQMDEFVDRLDRLGVPAVCAALGFRGGDGYGVDDAENLIGAFENLLEADAAQALRKLAMHPLNHHYEGRPHDPD